MKYLALIIMAVAIAAGAQVAPVPGKPVVRLLSPRATQLAGNNQAMVRTAAVVVVAPRVIVLAADFEPTQISGLTAYIDVKSGSIAAPWVRLATLPYPATGGTFAAPWTNPPTVYYQRAGFQFPK